MKTINRYVISFLPVVLSLMFFSCDGNVIKVLNKELSSADNVKIYFYDKATGKMPNTGSVVSINDKEEVRHFLASITEEDFPKRPDCVYNGLVEFFNGSKSLMNMEFNMEPNCGFVVFKIRDVMQSKKISEEGTKLLNFYYGKIAN